MVMFTFVGGAAAYRAGAHIAVAMLTDASAAGAAARDGVAACDGLMLLVCAFVVWYGTRLCLETWGQYDRRAAVAAGGRRPTCRCRSAALLDAAVRDRAHGVRLGRPAATSVVFGEPGADLRASS